MAGRGRPRKNPNKGAQMTRLIDDLRLEFHRHCERDAKGMATMRTTLDILKDDVGAINRAVTKGANGKSLCERVAVIEAKVIDLERSTASIERVLDQHYKLRFGFWGPIAAALIATIGAVVVAILK